jgi:site-specific DNA-methyltransferase (adenine-specific)
LFTYEGDVVLDPFMGSGTTAVAAKNTGRHYVGYDTDPSYVKQARERVKSLAPREVPDRRTLKDMARTLLNEAGYTGIDEAARVSPGVTVSFRGIGPDGVTRVFELGGVNTPARPGLSRVENVWKSIAKAAICREVAPDVDVVVLTVGAIRGGPLAAVSGDERLIAAVIDASRKDALERILAL